MQATYCSSACLRLWEAATDEVTKDSQSMHIKMFTVVDDAYFIVDFGSIWYFDGVPLHLMRWASAIVRQTTSRNATKISSHSEMISHRLWWVAIFYGCASNNYQFRGPEEEASILKKLQLWSPLTSFDHQSGRRLMLSTAQLRAACEAKCA